MVALEIRHRCGAESMREKSLRTLKNFDITERISIMEFPTYPVQLSMGPCSLEFVVVGSGRKKTLRQGIQN